MSIGGTPLAKIPNEWTQTVVRILREGANSKISITFQARIDWETTFPEATRFDRFDAMANALDENPIQGRKVERMLEKGEVYEFWFHFQGRRLYGKINLLPARDKILIYSSHLPRKGDEL